MNNMFRILITCVSIILVFSLTGCQTSKRIGLEQKKSENIIVVNTGELSGKQAYEVEAILGRHLSETATSELVKNGSTFINKGYKINASGNLLLNREYKINGKTATVFFVDDIVSGWAM
jgi:hypothetical protein